MTKIFFKNTCTAILNKQKVINKMNKTSLYMFKVTVARMLYPSSDTAYIFNVDL